jgi:CHAT domain-containing protein
VIAQGETSGEAHGTFTVPLEARDVENFVLRMSRGGRTTRRVVTSSEKLQAKDVGGRLFAALFQGPVRDVYRSCLADARHAERGLRVTLALTKAPELNDLPWEYLFDDPDFLAASIWTPVVRYLDVARPASPLKVTPPLRVLGMISSPDDVAQLDVAAERQRIEAALRPLARRGRVELHWTQEPTLEALLRKLLAGEFHIFHFVGHGAFDEVSGDGVLLLEDERGRSQRVTGEEIGIVLNDHRPMRLAVLNACEGARSSDSDPFAGVAASLVRRGLPAVVAMQFEITDDAAVTFAEHFYEALTLGYPVDATTALARQGIYASGNDVEWGTPVLFMRAADGRIFDVPAEARSEGPSLTASLESQPAEAAAGTPVTWSLYVENTGRPSLFGVRPRASDSVPACAATELLSGENTVFTWQSVAQEAQITVTVEAATAEGAAVQATATGRNQPVGEVEKQDDPGPGPRPSVLDRLKRWTARHRLPIAVAAAVAAAILVVAVIRGSGDDAGTGFADTGPGTGQPLVVAVPDGANGMASDDDGPVWVSTRKGAVGIKASGDTITRGREASIYGRAISREGDSLWVPVPEHDDAAGNRVAGKVVQLSARTGAPQEVGIRPEGNPHAIRTTGGKVYVSQSDGASTWVQAYDAGNGQAVGSPITVRDGTERIDVRGGDLWVISQEDPSPDLLVRYDLASRKPTGSVEVGEGASAFSNDGHGSFWITLSGDGAVARVRASDLDLVDSYAVGGEPANLRISGDDIWVTNPGRGVLQRLDRRSGDVRDEVDVPPRPYSLALTSQGIWVGDTSKDRVTLVAP